MSAKKAHTFLLNVSKKEKHHEFYKFMQSTELISIETRTDHSLSLKYFLVKTIIGQQVSTKAAQSIWQKVKTVLDNSQSQITLNILKEQGLSTPKATYILGIIQDESIEKMTKESLKKLSLEDLTQFFLSLKGVGPWTLGVVRMFFHKRYRCFFRGRSRHQQSVV